MKKIMFLLVLLTGIFSFEPLQAQTTDPIQPREESIHIDSTPSPADTSVVLLSQKREKPYSMTTLFRGLLGMAALVALGFLMSSDRKNIPWATVLTGLVIQVILAIGVLYVP